MMFGSSAGLISKLSGLILPKNSDTEALEENKTWRIIFAFPFLFFFSSLIGFLLFIRHDSPKYYISRGERAKAIDAIHSVYETGGAEYPAQRIISDFERKINSAAKGGSG